MVLPSSTVIFLLISAASNINFLYVHHQYDWQNTMYSTVASTFSIVGIFTMFITVPLFKRFNLGDVALGIVGNSSLLAKNVTTGFSVHPGLYYLGKCYNMSNIESLYCKVKKREIYGNVIIIIILQNINMQDPKNSQYHNLGQYYDPLYIFC